MSYIFYHQYLFFNLIFQPYNQSLQVNDLEVELESTKQRSIENLQQAILSEREHVTQMQWDMYELQRKYSEMVSKLEIEQV